MTNIKPKEPNLSIALGEQQGALRRRVDAATVPDPRYVLRSPYERIHVCPAMLQTTGAVRPLARQCTGGHT
jgi:hypothetical protein